MTYITASDKIITWKEDDTWKKDVPVPSGGSIVFDEKRVTVNSPKQWSAEKPELYALSLNLSDEHSNALESSALLVGFREIEYTMTEVDSANKNITDSYGRITINGQPLLMKGTNRHDTDPLTGKYVSKELYDIDLKTMKQYNINTIRTSHYANDEYLYYLADTQGFYLMAETNAECHAIANKDRNTAEVYQTILRPMFMDRTKTAYETLKNHSSIVSWSIGNECGGTSDANKQVYDEMVKYFHDNDPTRFVHSEFMGSNGTVDVMSNMYPGVETVENWAVAPDNEKDTNKTAMPYLNFEGRNVAADGSASGSGSGSFCVNGLVSYKGKETDPNYVDNTLEVSALHYSTKDLRNGTKHPYELTSSSSYNQESNVTYFNVDHKSLGIGNASCGPQAREDARINTGYIFDYEYTFVPTAKGSTDEYTQLSKAWRATESTTAEDPEFAIEPGRIGYTTLSAGLPSTVVINGESHAVAWEESTADCEVYEDTEITGVLDDKTVVTGEICVYPDNMYYFVDCNDEDPAEYNGVKSVSPALKNETADKTE